METTNDKWVSLSPQAQVEIPDHMSEEAGVPVTEIPMNLSVGRLKKNPHIHNTILKKLWGCQEIRDSSIEYLPGVKWGFGLEIGRRGFN